MRAALGFNFLTTFSDMENTQENPTSQNPTPADEAARQAAEAAAVSRKLTRLKVRRAPPR